MLRYIARFQIGTKGSERPLWFILNWLEDAFEFPEVDQEGNVLLSLRREALHEYAGANKRRGGEFMELIDKDLAY